LVRFATVGTNWITEALIQSAMKVQGFELAAVYSRSQTKAAEFAGKFGGPKIFTDLEEMAKSDVIDAVYIASPNSFHGEQAILFMKNKKHVLCEKPIASNVKELKRMIKTAKENRVLLMEALKTSFLPNFRSIQDSLQKIGPIRRFFASYCQYSSRYDAYREGTVLNAFKPEFSNGALMDIGVYCIYPAVLLFGKPLDIKANGFLLESGVDGQGSIILQYKDKEVVILFSKIANSLLPSEIQGEDGIIVIDKMNPPERVKVYDRNGVVEDVSREQRADPMYYEVQAFIELIHKGQYESTINSYEHSLLVMEILEEARRQIGVIYPGDKEEVAKL
jgi:predicted dehydrogenase